MAKRTSNGARMGTKAAIIAYLAALGLATSSSANHPEWRMYVNYPVTYAKEIFATPLTVTLSADNPLTSGDGAIDEQTSVELHLFVPGIPDGGTGPAPSIGGGGDSPSEVEVTLKLSGATFGQAINWTDIIVGTYSDGENRLAKVSGSQTDGRQGDSSVTFKLRATSTITGRDVDNYVMIDVGSLSGYSGAGSVTVTPEFRVTGGPQNNFSTTFNGKVERVTNADGVETTRGSSNVLASTVTAVKFAGMDGGKGNIDLANRAKLAGTQTRVVVGSIKRTVDSAAKAKDGATSFAGASGAGSSYDVDITVTGNLRAGDTVFYDQDGDKARDNNESLSITNGVATGSFRSGDGTVYYVPDGTTAMSAGMMTAKFSVEYDASALTDPPDVMGKGELVYNGVESKARAYAIPNLTHADQGNVRIKCEARGDAACTVFLDCAEQDGTTRFGELGSTIAANATEHLTESEIAAVLGIDDWTGRLSCDVLSSNAVSVQVLVRSGESLVNNTYVEGGAATTN